VEFKSNRFCDALLEPMTTLNLRQQSSIILASDWPSLLALNQLNVALNLNADAPTNFGQLTRLG
jgi:hypothetical protein